MTASAENVTDQTRPGPQGHHMHLEILQLKSHKSSSSHYCAFILKGVSAVFIGNDNELYILS